MSFARSSLTYQMPGRIPGAPTRPPHCGTPISAFALAYPILFSVLVSLGSTIISAGVSMAFAQFTKKPKKNPFSMEDRTITVRQTIQPWQIVLGSARVGGDIFFFEKKGTDVWLGIVWAAHECKAVDSIYTDDTQNFVLANAGVAGTNSGKIKIWHHLGDPDQLADENLKTNFPLKWTDDHRGRGRCYSVVQLVNVATNWGNSIPNISADLRGALVTDSRTGQTGYTNNAALLCRHFVLDDDWGEGAEIGEMDNANFNAEGNICDEEIALPNWIENCVIDNGRSDDFTILSTVADTLDLTGITSGTVETEYPDGTPVGVSNSGGALPASTPQITEGTVYYFNSSATNDGTLHPTYADAIANTNRIDFTGTGTGTHTIHRLGVAGSTDILFRMLGRETTFTVNTGTDLLTMTDYLSVDAEPAGCICMFDTTTTLPAPLAKNRKYMISDGDGGGPGDRLHRVQQLDGTFVNFTTTGTGIHTVRLFGRAKSLPSTEPGSDGIFNAADLDPRYVGKPLRLLAESGTTPPNGYEFDRVYYMVPQGNTALFGLAESRDQAEAGIYIVPNPAADASSGYTIEAVEVGQDEMAGITTGMVVYLGNPPGASADSIPGNFSSGSANEYRVIRRGRKYFQLADSLAAALAGTPRSPTADNGTFVMRLRRERRYTIDGAFDTDQDPRDVLKAMNTAHAGAVLEPLGTGKWRIKVGAYRVPVHQLGLNDVTQGGAVDIQSRIARQQAANTVKAVYTSPLNFDHPTDVPAYSDARHVKEDGGEQLVLDTQYPFTNSKFMAQRLARIDQRRKRLQKSATFPARMPSAARMEWGDGVRIDLTPLPITVNCRVTNWNYKVTTEQGGAPRRSIELALQEESPWIYREPLAA